MKGKVKRIDSQEATLVDQVMESHEGLGVVADPAPGISSGKSDNDCWPSSGLGWSCPYKTGGHIELSSRYSFSLVRTNSPEGSQHTPVGEAAKGPLAFIINISVKSVIR